MFKKNTCSFLLELAMFFHRLVDPISITGHFNVNARFVCETAMLAPGRYSDQRKQT